MKKFNLIFLAVLATVVGLTSCGGDDSGSDVETAAVNLTVSNGTDNAITGVELTVGSNNNINLGALGSIARLEVGESESADISVPSVGDVGVAVTYVVENVKLSSNTFGDSTVTGNFNLRRVAGNQAVTLNLNGITVQ